MRSSAVSAVRLGSSSSLLVWLVIAVLGACSEPKTPIANNAPSASTTNSSTPPDPIASNSAAPAVTTPPAPPSPFHVVSRKVLSVFPLENTTLILGPGLGRLEQDGSMSFDPALMRGIEPRPAMMASEVQVAGGRWPDLAFAAMTVPYGRTGLSEVYQWQKDHWQNVHRTDQSWGLHRVFSYTNNSALLVEKAYMMIGYKLKVVSTGSKPRTIKVTQANQTKVGFAESKVAMSGVDVLPDGNIFVVGSDAEVEGNIRDLLLEKVDPTGKTTIEVLPGSRKDQFVSSWEEDGARIYMANTTDGWIAGEWFMPQPKAGDKPMGPYLAHFDGKKWTEVTPPSTTGRFRLGGKDAKGNVWGYTPTEVFKHAAGDGTNWTKFVLPSSWEKPDTNSVEIQAIDVTSNGTVLVSVKLNGPPNAKGHATWSQEVVLSNAQPAKEWVVPSDDDYKASVRKVALPRPPTADCETPFVLLYTLSSVAAPNFDYPATRKALTGHTEFAEVNFIEFTRDKKRYFGARFPKYADWVLPKKMLELIKKDVVGSSPQLVCHDPEDSRVLKIDLKTGALLPLK